MLKKIMFLSLTICATFGLLQSKSAIILVHGAFIAQNSWMHEGSKFYDALQNTTNSLVHIESFYWDQHFDGIFAFEKISAAKKLADLIIKLRNTGYDHIEAYTHSYGADIVAIASQLLDNDNDKIEIIIQRNKTNRTHSMIERTEEYQTANKHFIDSKHNIMKHLAHTPQEARDLSSSYFINMIHTFAIPQEEIFFRTNMKTVEYVINGWSHGTLIQHLVGTSKSITDHERSTNLEYIIEQEANDHNWLSTILDAISNFILGDPSQSNDLNELKRYTKLLGKWLPTIPFTLAHEKINNFENFSFDRDGIVEISLDLLKPPHYRFETR